jgi:hypothetical protein
MKRILLLIIALVLTTNIFSQKSSYSTKDQYYFDDFMDADVYLNQNKKTLMKLNYNVLLDEMHYLNNTKLTRVGNLNDIVIIKFEKQIFTVYNDEFYKLVYANKNKVYSKLVPNFNVLNKPETGAYGTSTENSSVGKMSAIEDKASFQQILTEAEKNGEVHIPVNEKYYVFKNNVLESLDRKAVYNLYPEYKSEIKSFIKKNKLSLRISNDIETLFEYCESL